MCSDFCTARALVPTAGTATAALRSASSAATTYPRRALRSRAIRSQSSSTLPTSICTSSTTSTSRFWWSRSRARRCRSTRALEVLYRFGRAYPTHWEPNGRGGHCAERVEWLSRGGTVLAVSDYENKERYLRFVCERRVPCVASHWEYLMRPLVLHHADEDGPDPLPGDRVSAHAADELPGVRRYDEADARGPRAPGFGDPARQFADPAVLRVLPAGLRDPLLLRPLLGERPRARLERHALHLQRPRVYRDRRLRRSLSSRTRTRVCWASFGISTSCCA